jgi:mRNA interferase RelE/StbE
VSYRIELSPPAKREIRALPGYVRAQALQLLESLTQQPRPPKAKELRDKPGIYRVWLAGQWRIAYLVEDDLQRIRVLRVRRKEQIEYESLEVPGQPDE